MKHLIKGYGILMIILGIVAATTLPDVFNFPNDFAFKCFRIGLIAIALALGYVFIFRNDLFSCISPLSKVDILKEIAQVYSLRSRAMDGMSCVYLSPEGRKCAFSYCCTDAGVKELALANTGISGLDHKPDYYLKECYKGHSVEFWLDVQEFHDCYANWDLTGLSPTGEEKLNKLLVIYKN